MPALSAAHRRLLRRRVLTQLSAPSPPKQMKKKKPKKSSPSKSPPKGASSAKSSQSKSIVKDLDLDSAPIVSDAQIGSPADTVAQQSLEVSDLAVHIIPASSDKTVIVDTSADPSFTILEAPSDNLGSSSEVPPSSSPDTVTQDIVVRDIKDASSPPLNLANADANNDSLSSQLASDEGVTIAPPVVVESVAGVGVDASSAQPVLENAPQKMENVIPSSDTWCAHAKGLGKRLSKKGEAFTLPSGETCIKIPNSVIEKNRKSWEPFVMGQFYSDPPSQGTLHNIVNGIWSKHYRDIVVSKMEGFAFLFRIPNAVTRNRVIHQRLWQIEGQTMFVDKWEPGVVPVKPELTSAPIWLELRKVPFQFFNEDGLERIAGLVGHPKYLHPTTANKTNLEVAKVFTVIDPRKPLPEAVNVQFETGEICRVLVSSPWMPPVCEGCKEVGHATKRCPKIPKACSQCNSTSHTLVNCPQKRKKEEAGRKTRRGRSKEKQKWVVVDPNPTLPVQTTPHRAEQSPYPPLPVQSSKELQIATVQTEVVFQSKLGTDKDKAIGESSGTPSYLRPVVPRCDSCISHSSHSDVQPDSSDVESSESELEEGEFSQHEPDFEVVRNKKRFSGQKGKRGKGPKIN